MKEYPKLTDWPEIWKATIHLNNLINDQVFTLWIIKAGIKAQRIIEVKERAYMVKVKCIFKLFVCNKICLQILVLFANDAKISNQGREGDVKKSTIILCCFCFIQMPPLVIALAQVGSKLSIKLTIHNNKKAVNPTIWTNTLMQTNLCSYFRSLDKNMCR